ncbi:MAG: glyoxalase [Rhodospirillaceae bacterium]|nr:glyoxalase [Rhodospirillaceae bacterium]|tara:strand:+ start:9477 stop:9914 length:438 start_codon:yes stop_codon:yes gene_type:complete
MTTKSNPDDWWMTTGEYAKRMKGLTMNLLYKDVMAAVPFHTEVLGAELEFANVDFASFAFDGSIWMLHADHTYDSHPLKCMLNANLERGIGAEIRLHGRDPDEACEAAQRLGCTIMEPATSKGHGTREAFILDTEGYLWVPDILI